MKKILASILLSFILVLWGIPLYAATAPIYLGTVATTELTYSTTGNQTVVTGGASGTKLYNLTVTSTDTSTAHVMTCQVLTASAGTIGMSIAVNIPASSGIVATNPAVNMLQYFLGLQYDQNNNQFFSLGANNIIQCNYATALSLGALYIEAGYASY